MSNFFFFTLQPHLSTLLHGSVTRMPETSEIVLLMLCQKKTKETIPSYFSSFSFVKNKT